MPTGTQIQKHELANKRTFTAIPRQQTNRTQGNTATHLDIRDRAMGMQQAIQHQDPPNIRVKNVQNDQSALWYVSNQTLHSDFDIPYVREVVRINANKHKNRSTEHSNQLIRALCNLSVDRRLKRLWPQDLAQYHNSSEPPMDGACLTTFSYLNLTNYSV